MPKLSMLPMSNASSSRSTIRPLSRFILLLFVLSLAGTGLMKPARSVASRAVVETTISTLAGGGFGSNVPARQAPMVLPTGAALDPMGRGFYVIDEVDGTSLLRFVNTSPNPLTLAGMPARAATWMP